MHTRGVSERMAKDQETEEDRREEEAEVVTDTEMEQQASVKEDAQGDQPDKAVAREEPNWQDMMKFMAEQFRKQEENSKKQNEILSENLIKLMNEKFEKNKLVLYSDVYKRQVQRVTGLWPIISILIS